MRSPEPDARRELPAPLPSRRRAAPVRAAALRFRAPSAMAPGETTGKRSQRDGRATPRGHLRRTRQVVARQPRAAGRRFVEPGKQRQQSGLAGTRRADDRQPIRRVRWQATRRLRMASVPSGLLTCLPMFSAASTTVSSIRARSFTTFVFLLLAALPFGAGRAAVATRRPRDPGIGRQPQRGLRHQRRAGLGRPAASPVALQRVRTPRGQRQFEWRDDRWRPRPPATSARDAPAADRHRRAGRQRRPARSAGSRHPRQSRRHHRRFAAGRRQGPAGGHAYSAELRSRLHASRSTRFLATLRPGTRCRWCRSFSRTSPWTMR